QGETSLVASTGEESRGMRAVGVYEAEGRRRPTSLYVFVKGDLYLKYRISYNEEDRDLLEPHFEEWLRSTYETVESEKAR
ncbi:MAG: hypothetical protein ACRD3V_28380, partial [Vicinamibacteria bacterium]